VSLSEVKFEVKSEVKLREESKEHQLIAKSEESLRLRSREYQEIWYCLTQF